MFQFKSLIRIINKANKNVSSIRQISNDCNVGFIGLGNMGIFMALNIVNKGHQITVYDKNPNRIKELKLLAPGKDINVVKSLKEFSGISGLQAIVTMLPSSPQVIEVYRTESLMAVMKNNTVFIDCTTSDPLVSQEVSSDARNHGHIYVDAPVSGGVNAARDGNLTFMVGGTPDEIDQVSILLKKMGRNVFHCGAVGMGLAAKICNNMLLGISMIGVSEAMNLGDKLGLEPAVLANVINLSSGRCWSSDTYNPVPNVIPGVPSNNDYDGGFSVALMAKDLGLSQIASINKGANIPLGSAAYQMYRLLCQHGYGNKDFSVVYKFLNKK